MNIERDVFKRSRCDYDKLESYGFKKENDFYSFESSFLSDFNAIIKVDNNGNVSGKVIDSLTGEEYINIRTEMSGEFVNKVRDAYKSLLIDIKNNCFNDRKFISDQSNRIASYIKKTYSNDPEFLWEDTPGCGVFRNAKTKKWYGIIMNVDYSKLDNKTGEIEVMNVKLRENEILELVGKPGLYKAYHMNKKSWISIVLNDTLDDEIIFSLIDESYQLVS